MKPRRVGVEWSEPHHKTRKELVGLVPDPLPYGLPSVISDRFRVFLMSASPAAVDFAAPTARAPAGHPSLLRQYSRLFKVRLTAMVLVTTAVGYVMAAGGVAPLDRLLWTILGTGLAAAAASPANQSNPRSASGRPGCSARGTGLLPSGQMSPQHAWIVATVASFAGLGILNELVNPLTAALGLANLLIYVVLYTPLKPRTSLNTLVGAVCGALPPMMGWSAASGQLSLGAVLLGAILFVWQVPHFLAWPGCTSPTTPGWPPHAPGDRSERPADVPADRALLAGPAAAGLGGDLRRTGRLSLRRPLVGLGLRAVFVGVAVADDEDPGQRPPRLPGEHRLFAAVAGADDCRCPAQKGVDAATEFPSPLAGEGRVRGTTKGL